MSTYIPRHIHQNKGHSRIRIAVGVGLVAVVGLIAAWVWVVVSADHGLGTTSGGPASGGPASGRPASGVATPPSPPAAAPVQAATAQRSSAAGTTAANWIVAENRRPGTTAWAIEGTPPGVIAGFASSTSASLSQTVTLYVTTDAPTFDVEAFRMGYYGGAGGRLVWTSGPIAGRTQPSCPVTAATHMVSCANWSPSLQFVVTTAFVQGDYLFKLVGSGGQESYVPLTITDPTSAAALLVKNDVYTWQAWNAYGGYDLYAGLGRCPPDVYPPCNRARVVSFDRPYAYGEGAADFLGQEYPLVRFAEQHGLDVTYVTDVDVEQHPAMLLRHKVILSLGHDECWSLGERDAVQGAESHGVNVVFFGASPILRHVRPASSPLGPDREMVDYRDSAEDPLDGVGNPLQVTGNTWSDPPASWSEVPFVGENYAGYLEPDDAPVALVVSDASAWIYRGTGLRDGSSVPGLLDSDFDQVVPGDHPSNIEILSHSPMPRQEVQTQRSAPYSDMTYYTDPKSGAGVFDTGTVAWIPDLAGSEAVQQMTFNLLTVFGQGPVGDTHPSQANWSRFYS
jgi:hypothetical protein